MADVRVQALADEFGTPVAVGATLRVQVYEGLFPATRVVEESVTFPVEDQMVLTGLPDETFALYTLPAGFYWRVTVHWSQYVIVRNVVLPAGSGPFDFADLVDVNPMSALPDPASALADAFIAELEAIRDATIAAQSSASGVPFTQTTPLGSWVIPHGLARVPAVSVYIGGEQVIADVTASDTTVTVAFAAPQSGYALLT